VHPARFFSATAGSVFLLIRFHRAFLPLFSSR
jgi:hypothetical protein